MDGLKTITGNSGVLELVWPVDTETACLVEKAPQPAFYSLEFSLRHLLCLGDCQLQLCPFSVLALPTFCLSPATPSTEQTPVQTGLPTCSPSLCRLLCGLVGSFLISLGRTSLSPPPPFDLDRSCSWFSHGACCILLQATMQAAWGLWFAVCFCYTSCFSRWFIQSTHPVDEWVNQST